MTTERQEGDRIAPRRTGQSQDTGSADSINGAARAGQVPRRIHTAEPVQGTQRRPVTGSVQGMPGNPAAAPAQGIRRSPVTGSGQGTQRNPATEPVQGTPGNPAAAPGQAAREGRPVQRQRPRQRGTRHAYAEKQRRKEQLKRGYIDLLVRVVLLAAACWILLTQVFLVTYVTGNGMFPALKDGDLVFGFRLQREYAKNDVVVYEADGGEHIGRIVARATDVVTLDESGTLLVNGTVQGGEIMYPTYAEGDLEYPYAVPEGHVFVLGDYRTQTEDSRTLGAIPMEDVKGKVITILRRRGL